MVVLILYINLFNLSWIIKYQFLRNMEPFILMQFFITNISSVKPHSETHKIENTLMKPSKGLNGDLKPEHKTTTNRSTMSSIKEIDRSNADRLKQIEDGAVI